MDEVISTLQDETKRLVVVLPVSRMDWHLAIKWLRWSRMIDRQQRAYSLVVLCSPSLDAAERWRLAEAAGPWRNHGEVVVADIQECGYFGSPNQMFKRALEHVELNFPGQPMLWCEADTVPMHRGWVQEIESEYLTHGKPFMGDFVYGQINHMTGNAVYPPNWLELAPSLAALPGPDERWGWDSQCAKETLAQAAKSTTIRQVWRPTSFTAANYQNIVPAGTSLFHQDKTGTLIDVLCETEGMPHIPIDDQLEQSTYEKDKHLSSGPPGPRPALVVEILIVTCERDIGFLEYCLASIEKYARGFAGVTLLVPIKQEEKFQRFKTSKVKVQFFDEVEGKGMLHHEVMICRADELCPNATAILHMDADVMAWKPFTPDDFAPQGRPILVRERYHDCGRRNPNRMVWQGAVDRAVGILPEWETMVRHPQIHIREVYPVMRKMVEAKSGKPFDQYVLSCKNEFPQGFAEYPTLGAVAIKYFPGAYTMVDYDHESDARACSVPVSSFQYIYRRDRDKMVEFWSHGGIKRYEADARNFLSGQLPAYWVK